MMALVHFDAFGDLWESEACSIDNIELSLGPLPGSGWVGMLFFRDGVGWNSPKSTMEPFWKPKCVVR